MKFKDPIEAFPAVQEVLVERMLKSASFLRLLLLHLRNRDGQDFVLYHGVDLIQLGVLREPEPAMELPVAPLNLVPLICLLLLLAPLPAYLKYPAILYLNLNLLFLHGRKICLEDVTFFNL
ncbi:hypothetical protein AKJ16_DCAP09811 [Drosera capensis]